MRHRLVTLAAAPRRPFTLTAELPEGEPPKEFRLWPFGQIPTLKGTFTFDQAAAEKVMAAFKDYGNELSFDYEHQAIFGPPPAPAAGWFTLDLRDDGLWAVNVRWTERAAAFLRSKEYRYFSPAFNADGDKRITELVNVALTNIPATKHMDPLVASRAAVDRRRAGQALGLSFADVTRLLSEALAARQGEGSYCWIVDVYDDHAIYEHDGRLWSIGYRMDGAAVALDEQAVEVQRDYTPIPTNDGGDTTMKTLLKALGLPETATEAEALAALTALQASGQSFVALTGKASPAEAMGVLQAWKASTEQVATLSSQVTELQAKLDQQKVDEVIAAGKAAGKVTPAMEPELRKMPLATLSSFLEVAPKVAPEASHQPPSGGNVNTVLSAEDRAVCAQLGMKPEDFLAHKKNAQAQA